MKNRLVYFINSILILICLFGIYQVYEKAGIPVKFKDNKLIIEQIFSNNSTLQRSDSIVSVNNYPINSQEELEFILDSKSKKDSVLLTIKRNYRLISLTEGLVQFYSTIYLVMQLFASLVFISLALFVYVKRKEDPGAQMFNWIFMFSSIIICTTWGRYTIDPHGVGHFIRSVFGLSYSLTGVMFLHFTLIFPSKKNRWNRGLPYLYAAAIILTLISATYFHIATSNFDLVYFSKYMQTFNIIRIFFVLSVIAGIYNIFISYIRAKEEYERRKLRWILLGLAIGPAALIFLWILPQIVFSQGLIAEEYVVLGMLSVPITCSIAIVKYQLLNIDSIFKRGTIYLIVLFFVLIIYIISVIVTTIFIDSFSFSTSLISSTISAVIIASLFHPIKNWSTQFVDKKFFNVKYVYRKVEREFIEQLLVCHDEISVNNLVVDTINKYISCEFVRLVFSGDSNYKIDDFPPLDYSTKIPPYAKNEVMEPGSNFINLEGIYGQTNVAAVFIIASNKNGYIGLLLLGKKKSHFRFSLEDVDLISSICDQTALAMDRILFQQKLICEELESRRLKELNELKSFFVSSVTHELKTPLTAIKLFAELIEDSSSLSDEKKNEYSEIIINETDRLTRLIDNVLNTTKIEKGIKTYQHQIVNLNECITEAVRIMKYQLERDAFEYEINLDQNKLLLWGDRDSLVETIINLISNSIKYSTDTKFITISSYKEGKHIYFKIKDAGIGVCEKDRSRIFLPFERGSMNKDIIAGAGLGLAIVKHFVDAHNAQINLESEINAGTIITIQFSGIINEKYTLDN
jgi:signal transduction histidine kinase